MTDERVAVDQTEQFHTLFSEVLPHRLERLPERLLAFWPLQAIPEGAVMLVGRRRKLPGTSAGTRYVGLVVQVVVEFPYRVVCIRPVRHLMHFN
ncbi:hypothetical protein Bxe_C1097 [Paraburkholderia xenovorans LB400]|uniref:Uncharacterized protein n=1 Tax=Paraburkholderia xenovorans (strain LB400) TaxID=266265 RepID=Q13G25_PARXL|nr:hypothetical protein Bxe_C1097 [Paraburkholderia xenovorans LB400]